MPSCPRDLGIKPGINIIAVVILLTVSAVGAASDPDFERKSIPITRTLSPPVIDGQLGDEAWQHAARIDDFHQIEPTDGGPPSESMIVWVTYDDDYLYVAADLRDSEPALIEANQLVQGRLFTFDDRFWVSIDTFNSRRNDYFFQVNPNGIRRDALRENNSNFIGDWTTLWYAESAIHNGGWATEIAIPFKSMSFNPGSETWGINFGRGIARRKEFDLWSSYQREDWAAYGGEITGISGIRQGIGLDVTPSVTLKEHHDLITDQSDFDVVPSLDLRYRITPSLTGTLTINTDFSTAEVNDQQIALDRFSLFFPEKRNFFLQDAGIFEFGGIDTNGRPFFSRRIGLAADGRPIGLDAGIKLTGRIGDFNVGALAIRQQAEEDIEAKDLFVARGSYNILEESALGFIFTSGDPIANASNSVVGIDFLFRDSSGPFGKILKGQAWAQRSNSSTLQDDNWAFGAGLGIPADKVEVYANAEVIQANFHPALGFVNRTGIRRYDLGGRYRTRPETGRLRAINHRIDFTQVTDMDNRTLTQRMDFMPISFESHQGDFLFFEWQRNIETVREDFQLFGRLNVPAARYSFDRWRATLITGNHRAVSFILSVQDGGFFGGDRLETSIDLTLRPSAHFSLGVEFTDNEVQIPSGDFSAHTASLRAEVAFNSRWSWTSLLQYENASDAGRLDTRIQFVPEAGREVMLVVNLGSNIGPDNHWSSTQRDQTCKLAYTFRY